ncbi:DNA polymerase epsilon subunit 3 [Prunus yedoensis var. nudiflora]|uniref:DNA polymerase epsilon subunit 3 n=1 Tax=Prunus yedoensis var. nudiflora TaxID=2094558 RepID=A0A314YQC4_PRUYE|nr:DNA polymerase epsilon subunit 3 [Prunus yedoensis var. nudiflora]
MAKVVADAEELPKAIVRRVVKDKLSQCSKGDADLTLHKEALLAFSESARIFIHYLSATANDICKEKKRQTISADDVLKALEEIEFSEFIKPLEASLKEKNPGKNAGKNAAKSGGKNAEKSGGKNAGKQKAGTSKAKEVKKKRKLEEPSSQKQKEKEEDNQDENGSDDE